MFYDVFISSGACVLNFLLHLLIVVPWVIPSFCFIKQHCHVNYNEIGGILTLEKEGNTVNYLCSLKTLFPCDKKYCSILIP
jgi:hypothetical protein